MSAAAGIFVAVLMLGSRAGAAGSDGYVPGFADRAVVDAMAALEADDAQTALGLLQSFIAVTPPGPRRADARFLGAEAALQTGAADLALNLLTDLEAGCPEIADLVVARRARALRSMARWQETLQTWQELLDGWPKSPAAEAAIFGLADAHFALGDLDQARRAYERARKRAPRADASITARYNLARIAQMEGRFEESAAAFRYLAFRYPAHPLHDPARTRMQHLVDAGLAPAPTLAEQLAWIDRLLTARSLDEARVALDSLPSQGISTSKKRDIAKREAILAYRRDDYEAAQSRFSKLASEAKGRAERVTYEKWLARTLSAADRPEDAIAIYRTMAKRYANERTGREALFKAGWLAYNGGRHEIAIRLFGEFIETYADDSGVPDAMWFLAWNTYHLGDLPTAASTLARLRREHPRSALLARARYWEGRIAEQMGDAPLATAHFAAVTAAAPIDYYAAMARERLEELGQIEELKQHASLVASLSDERPWPRDEEPGLLPERDELPAHGGLRRRSSRALPWGAAVFNWQSDSGLRAIRLMRLGMLAEAADVVYDVPSLPGHSADAIAYARARLLYGLGDYNLAYRITHRRFRRQLAAAPTGQTSRFFRLAYPEAFPAEVSGAARELGVPADLVLALMRQESAFDARARSWASANGLMQIIPRTGRKIAQRVGMAGYNYGMLKDPAINIRFGTWYLSQLLERFGGHPALAVASYNAGPMAVSRWIDQRGGAATDEFVEDVPFRETRGYIKRVLGNLAIYRLLDRGGSLGLPQTVPTTYGNNVDF